MHPTLAEALATLPVTLEWLPDDPNTVEADIILGGTELRLDAGFYVCKVRGDVFRLTASIIAPDRPHIRVSVSDRPALLTAWTEVAEVVARVDAAAGAAMGLPRETKADAQEKT